MVLSFGCKIICRSAALHGELACSLYPLACSKCFKNIVSCTKMIEDHLVGALAINRHFQIFKFDKEPKEILEDNSASKLAGV